MGGLAGSWIVHRAPCIEELHRVGRSMAESIGHRGQQHEQQTLRDHGLSLAVTYTDHGDRRLAVSPGGRYVVAVAGRLDRDSNSSKEAGVNRLLATLMQVGTDATLGNHTGAACLAIWDKNDRSLTIARDRMGEGDVYYTCSAFGLIFSSDLQTITDHCPVANAVDHAAVAQLLQFGYIPAPRTVYQGVFKLERGSMRRFHACEVKNGFIGNSDTEQVAYWNHRLEIEAAIRNRSCAQISEQQALDGVDEQLADSINRANRGSRVCLLSGGVDSSLVASIFQRQSSVPVDTLTVGYEDSDHDESDFALDVARTIGAKNDLVTIRASNLPDLITCSSRTFSEPFADSAALPMIAAAHFAGGRWSSVMSGDGGDELFFGHSAYPKALRNNEMARMLPTVARQLADKLHQIDPERSRLGGFSALLAEARCNSLAETYLARVSRWRSPSAALTRSDQAESIFTRAALHPAGVESGEMLLFLDQAMELPEGLLTRSDRAFSSRGIEVINPFLSLNMVELSWHTPMAHKYARGMTKSILKKALERHLPKALVHRPKKGLGAPVSDWLRGPLREWAESLLSRESLERGDVLNAERVRRVWHSFLGGKRKLHTHLWPVLMFLVWEGQHCKANRRRQS